VIPKQLDSPSTSLLGVKQLSGGHGPVSPDTPHLLAGNPGTGRKPRSHGTSTRLRDSTYTFVALYNQGNSLLGATPRTTHAALTSWGIVCDDASGLFVFCKDLTGDFTAQPLAANTGESA
jgi:hypothetical protein